VVCAAGASFEFGETSLAVRVEGEHTATYVWDDGEITRPHFKNLVAPGGERVTRRYPADPVEDAGNLDHATYHPGLWMAFGDLSGADHWRLKAEVTHAGFVDAPDADGFAVRDEYRSGSGEVLATSLTRYAFHAGEGATLITVDATFTPSGDSFYFGDQEEMGLGVRLATDLTVKHGDGVIVNSEGGRNEAGTWGKRADWCMGYGTRDGETLGIVVMTHPENFRKSWFHSRDYGLIVANPFGKKAMTGANDPAVKPDRTVVEKGAPLRLRFGVVLFKGAPKAEAWYAGYVAGSAWATRLKAQPDLYLLDESKRVKKQLTDDARVESWPSWSPDGKRIAYATVDPKTLRSRIDVYDVEEDRRETILSGPNNYYDPAWSPKGDQLLFTTNAQGGTKLGVYDFASTGTRMLPMAKGQAAYAHGPIWMPDGTKIAYMTFEMSSRLSQIYVMEWPGGTPRRVAEFRAAAALLDWNASTGDLLVTAETGRVSPHNMPVWELWQVSDQSGERSRVSARNPNVDVEWSTLSARVAKRLNSTNCLSSPVWAAYRPDRRSYCVLICFYPFDEPGFYQTDTDFNDWRPLQPTKEDSGSAFGFIQFTEQSNGGDAVGVWSMERGQRVLSCSRANAFEYTEKLTRHGGPIGFALMGPRGEIIVPPQDLMFDENLIAIYKHHNQIILHLDGYGYDEDLMVVGPRGEVKTPMSSISFLSSPLFPKWWPFVDRRKGPILPAGPCTIFDKSGLQGEVSEVFYDAWLVRTADHMLLVPPAGQERPPVFVGVERTASGFVLWDHVGAERTLLFKVDQDRKITVGPEFAGDTPYAALEWAYVDDAGAPVIPPGERRLVFSAKDSPSVITVSEDMLSYSAGAH
jgi:hypothetical protein